MDRWSGVTPEELGVDARVVRTRPAGSAEESAELQGIPLGALIRTLVVRRGEGDYLFVLVPGGRRFDWPKLRAHLGVKRMTMPAADEATAATGYERGAITPFGASRAWPVIADAAVLEHETVAIGGGARGVNLHLSPHDLVRHLRAEVVDVSVAIERPMDEANPARASAGTPEADR
jgi:Cys-tRNA(Pro)/Cys-tRNA(Cys) deacylase